MNAWEAFVRSGALGARPARSAGQAVAALARHGPTLLAVAAWAAARFPDAPALVEHALDGDAARAVATTFRELLTRAERAADALAARLPPGATVAVLGRNGADLAAALLAGPGAGLRTLLLNTTASPEATLDLLRAQGSALLVADPDFLPVLLALRPGLPVLALPDLGRAPARPRRPRRPGRLVLLTSGSTGPPKAVSRRPGGAELARVLPALIGRLGLRSGAPTLLTLPLFHGHGLSTLALGLALGAPLHVFARGTPEGHLRVLAREGVEVLVLVPTVLRRLLDRQEAADGPAFPRVRTVVSGSAPLDPVLARRAFSRWGPVLHDLYGSSERGLVALATPEHLLAAPGSVGYALLGVPAWVRREDGTRAAPGEVGEVVVGRTRSAAPTGDLGRLGPGGLLTLVGRTDDRLNLGGEKVSPEEVEARLAAAPGVRECAVAPVPSEEYGQAVEAFVVAGAGREGEAARALADLAARLPRAWRPVRVTFVAALPRTALGKLVRARLAELRREA